MPTRRFNFTGRKRIEQRNVTIELQETGDSNPPTFSVTLNLAELRLPEDARVIITAIRGRGRMGFDWGTVGSPIPPADCSLTEVPVNPVFRVIALDDSGKILALANSISPKRAAGRESLLWLEEVDLAQEVWRLDFGESGENPTLQVNKNIRGIGAAMRQDDALRGVILPEVLRAILTRALIVEEFGWDDEDGEGLANWVKFTKMFHSVDYPETGENGNYKGEVARFIDDAVKTFTKERFHASELYAKSRES